MPQETDILRVTRELLIRDGFSKLSMRKIANELDVTATTLYHYFENKDDLLLALVEDSIRQLADALRQSMEQEADPVTRLGILTDTFWKFALDHPQEYEVIYMVRPEEMPKFPKEKFQEIRSVYEMLAGVIQDGVEAGLLDVEDPLVSAYTLWAQLHGVVSVILSRRLDTRISQSQFLEQAKDHIIQGFITQKTPA
ncbi:MAG: TetR/AcrR family transcriptional regulator [Bacteroidetes bacterium]|jgi:AcrR family transcriptional regulator|nr:TetR/AcrR family transcriptional regulator [Bacteroidota bacterium]PTM15986.1 MAG: TetR/AcrR family transcriptional regulator [Bacteroidota bacterium]